MKLKTYGVQNINWDNVNKQRLMNKINPEGEARRKNKRAMQKASRKANR